MRKQTLILFTLFVVVAIVGIAFAFLYRRGTDSLLERFADQIASCESITDEQACFQNEKCEGIYASNGNEQMPEFLRCQEIPEKFAAEYEREQTLCHATGGRWLRTKFGNFCQCDEIGAERIFDAVRGCVKQ